MRNLILSLFFFVPLFSVAQGLDCDIKSFCFVFDECINDSTYRIRMEFGADSEGPWNVLVDGDFRFQVERREFGESLLLESGSIHTLTVESDENPDCYTQITLPWVDCSESGNDCEDCEIWDLIAEAGEPNDDCEFYIDIDFNAENTCSDTFIVFVNGEDYCCWVHGEDFYTIGPFNTETEVLRIQVVDFENPECESEVFELVSPDCEDEGCDGCEIWDLYGEATEPDEDCNYYIEFDFEYANVCSDTFITRINGVADCCRLYDENGYRVGPFNTEDGPVEILVWDFENRDCHSREVLIDVPDCMQLQCENFEDVEEIDSVFFSSSGIVFYGRYGCEHGALDDIGIYENNNGLRTTLEQNYLFFGTFEMDFTQISNPVTEVSFAYSAEARDFYISINGAPTVEIVLDQNNPTVINSFPGYEVTFDRWINGYATIKGPAIESILLCGSESGIDNVCYETECSDCRIFEFIAEAGEPNEDCFFDIDFAFDYENRCSDTFYVEIDGDLVYGSVDWDENFYTIPNFYTEKEEIELTIYDFGNPECSQTFVLETPDCADSEDCKMYDLEVVVGDVVSDSTYYITIDFEHSNTNPAGFDLYWDHTFYGFYDYNDLPLTILVTTRGLEWEYIRVSDNDNPDCFDEAEFKSPVWTELIEIDFDEMIELNDSSIKIISEDVDRIECYDVLGRKYGEINQKGEKFDFEQNRLKTGVYYFKLTDREGNIAGLAVPFIR